LIFVVYYCVRKVDINKTAAYVTIDYSLVGCSRRFFFRAVLTRTTVSRFSDRGASTLLGPRSNPGMDEICCTGIVALNFMPKIVGAVLQHKFQRWTRAVSSTRQIARSGGRGSVVPHIPFLLLAPLQATSLHFMRLDQI
jgi:hypothetical protein